MFLNAQMADTERPDLVPSINPVILVPLGDRG
jgi:hypothetical protein